MVNLVTSVALCSLCFIIFICRSQCLSRYCINSEKNYTECAIMYWTDWKTCTGGHGLYPTECNIGFEKRQKAVCCPRSSTNETRNETFQQCKNNCNMTDDDFQEFRPVLTTVTPTTRIIFGMFRPTAGRTLYPLDTYKDTGDNEQSGLLGEEIATIAGATAAGVTCLTCFLIVFVYKKNKRNKKIEPEEKVIIGTAPQSTASSSVLP